MAVEVIEMLRISFPVSASLLLSAEHERARFAPRAEAGEKSEHQFSAILVEGDCGICGVIVEEKKERRKKKRSWRKWN